MRSLRTYIVPVIIAFLPSLIQAQDYFDDAKGSGLTVLTGKTGDAILSTRFNIGDNSIKVNFFQQYRLNQIKQPDTIDLDTYPKPPVKPQRNDIGWGAYVKGKSENGLATIFSTGSLVPGFEGNLYLSFRHLQTDSTEIRTETGSRKIKVSRWWVVLLSGGYSITRLNLYDPAKTFQKQLYDTLFQGWNAGISGFYILPVHRAADNLILGGSVSLNRLNNYGGLKKVEIKDITQDTSGGVIRQVTPSRSSYIYCTGNYAEYLTARIRASVAWIPKFLGYRVAFILYPSVNLSAKYSPRYNTGISFQFLKKGSPTVSIGGIYVEFNDMGNAFGSDEPFVTRCLTFGLTASVNIMKQ